MLAARAAAVRTMAVGKSPLARRIFRPRMPLWKLLISRITPVKLQSEDVWVSGNDGDVKKVQYVYTAGETKKIKSGSPMKDYPATQYAAGFHLKYGSKGWRVEGVAWKDANDVQD